ncbi:uncharacterized protein BT62DRAFT_981620 [Guyanagaster necrorhizus]|uniref:GH16 domain-containing protein n=1 Tax=Guyanagaster necrorhizus TaxID=856835 RepID=A0A9P7VP74_9AGAR|nr:uncharacterized protein BT62DRAFT_981620 [Guyanagaster necrorhizus MCA 3950]KAG7444339.1 hypothetical protein BT62DRAFT_981620 [Guyanagaster necrorhizus MCA 3950]
MSSLCLLAIFFFISTVIANPTFKLTDVFRGSDFFDRFRWETFDDPTHGRVNCIDKNTAEANNLSCTSSHNSKFIMRANANTVVPPDARGRDSSLIILDTGHMQTGCGTWPAFWTLSEDGPWPQGGEIDIIQGVSVNTNNLTSLHTTENCAMLDMRVQSGCNFNQGCGTAFTQPNSYGPGFNEIQGRYFTMSKDNINSVQVWFWPRNSSIVSQEVCQVPNSVPVCTESWGNPDASFPVDRYGYDSHFSGGHIIVFDITFCGDWAGTAFAASGGIVDNRTDSFSEAYWKMNSLYVYDRITG